MRTEDKKKKKQNDWLLYEQLKQSRGRELFPTSYGFSLLLRVSSICVSMCSAAYTRTRSFLCILYFYFVFFASFGWPCTLSAYSDIAKMHLQKQSSLTHTHNRANTVTRTDTLLHSNSHSQTQRMQSHRVKNVLHAFIYASVRLLSLLLPSSLFAKRRP